MIDPVGAHTAIIDGHAQFFRAYYAIRGGLSSPVTGEPTNLVFGFISTLFSYIRAQKPTDLVVVFDETAATETSRPVIPLGAATNSRFFSKSVCGA